MKLMKECFIMVYCRKESERSIVYELLKGVNIVGAPYITIAYDDECAIRISDKHFFFVKNHGNKWFSALKHIEGILLKCGITIDYEYFIVE